MKNIIKILIVVIIGVATNVMGFLSIPLTTITTKIDNNLKIDKMENEIWKDVKGYEGLYQVSNLSRVKGLNRFVDTKNGYCKNIKERILTLGVGSNGYWKVSLNKNNHTEVTMIHRIICNAFIPNPENKLCVNHKDGNKLNNSIENLEWCTYSENSIHAFRTGLKKPPMLGKFGKEHSNSKIIFQYSKDGIFINLFHGAGEAERATGIRQKNIWAACYGTLNTAGGYVWKNIG
jgi:hypothetical protein